MKSIGTAKLTQFDKWIAYIKSLSRDELHSMTWDGVSKYIDHDKTYANMYYGKQPEWYKACLEGLRSMFTPNGYSNMDEVDKFLLKRDKTVERMEKILSFATEFEQPIHVGYWDKNIAYCFMGNPEKGFVVFNPDQYMEFIPAPDWSATTPSALREQLLGDAEPSSEAQLVPADAQQSLTVKDIKDSLESTKSEMDRLNELKKQAEKYETEELAEMKRELERIEKSLKEKCAAMVAEYEEKLEEAQRKKDALEAEIYMLDSQIYAIYCYAGETVKFIKLKSGKNAPDTEPLVIYQKLRFLDEDLGRMASIYRIDWSKINMFEDFLRYSPEAQEMFCPNEKCVMLVRVSRTGLLQKMSFYEHCQLLENYEYYHGNTVGIIIRNGENIYLGWTDQERVHIKDDLLISKTITEVAPAEEPPKFTFKSDKEAYYKKQKQERFDLVDGIISRRFVYSILQGIVDHSNLLSMPKGTNLGKQGPLVVYAVSDLWLTDNRFGTFNDIVSRCNRHVTKGDKILTLCMLVPHSGQYNNNDRGIGYNNRTHDCEVPDCKIMTVNLVTDKLRTRKYRMKYKTKGWQGKIEERTANFIADDYDEFVKNPEDTKKVYDGFDFEIQDEFIEISHKVYVSVPKGEKYWRIYTGDDPRANFRLDYDEYINLTYMNSVWLLYAINNKKLGGWKLDGKEVTYAYAIRYLNTALDYIRDREKKEKELLDAIDPKICEDPDWPVKLSEWKLSNDERPVREMNEFQSKRFARSLGYIVP